MSVNKQFAGAFSMGTSVRRQEDYQALKQNYPGPGEKVELTFYNKPNPMQTKIGTEEKGLKPQKKRAPSPGTYEIKNSVGVGLKYSIGGGMSFQQRSKLQKEQKFKNELGPGNYDPSFYNKQKMPKYSLGYKTVNNFTNRSDDPNGPGFYYQDEYERKKQIQEKKIHYSKLRDKYEEIRQRSQSQKTKRENHYSSLQRYTQSGFMSSSMARTYNESGFGYGERQQLNKNIVSVPGPGTYHLNHSQKEIQRQFKIGEKLDHKNVMENNPGPNHYDPLDQKGNKKNPKSYSLSGKMKNAEKVDMDIPGSQKYFPQEIKKKLNMKIGKGPRGRLELSKFQQSVPGPGNYEVIQQSSAGFKFSFGYEERDKYWRYKDICQKHMQENNLTTSDLQETESQFRKTEDYESIQQSSAGFHQKNPVKCKYCKMPKKKPRVTKFKDQVEGSQTDKSQKDKKEMDFLTSNNNKEEQFNSNNDNLFYDEDEQENRKEYVPDNFPGPGNYKITKDSRNNDGRKFKLRGRGEKPNKAYKVNLPGPGNYESKLQEKNTKAGDIGRSSRFDNRTKMQTPGPGSYEVTGKFDGRKSGFGKVNKKPQVYKLPQPGPGSYEVPTTVAYIPKYLIRNKQVDELQNLRSVVEF